MESEFLSPTAIRARLPILRTEDLLVSMLAGVLVIKLAGSGYVCIILLQRHPSVVIVIVILHIENVILIVNDPDL